MSGLTKDVRRLIRDAQSWEGWRIEQTKAGWMLYPPNRQLQPVAVHGTPSDRRAWQNILARLRRSGAPV